MPLEKGKSKKAFKHNVRAEVKAGKPVKQAVAIAYKEKGEAKKTKDCGITMSDALKAQMNPKPSY